MQDVYHGFSLQKITKKPESVRVFSIHPAMYPRDRSEGIFFSDEGLKKGLIVCFGLIFF